MLRRIHNMSSPRHSAQALIKEKSPKVVYARCSTQTLILAIIHSCNQPLIRNMVGKFNEVFNFLSIPQSVTIFC